MSTRTSTPREPLLALPMNAIRARKRPGAIALLYLWELGFALLVATPVHAWARREWGSHPDGDALLWQPGGHALLAWIGDANAALPMVIRTAIVMLAVGAAFSQLPLGALFAALGFARDDEGRAPRSASALRAGINAFFPLVVVLAFLALTDLVVLGIGGAVASAANTGFERSLGDARSFQLHVVLLALFVLLSAFIGVFFDLVRAAIGREAGLASIRGSVHPAWNVMLRGLRVAITASKSRGLLRAFAAWLARWSAGVVLLGVGWMASSFLGGMGGAAVVALFAIHQLVVLGRVALRASWLAHAMRLVIPAQDDLLERAAAAASALEEEKPVESASADVSA